MYFRIKSNTKGPFAKLKYNIVLKLNTTITILTINEILMIYLIYDKIINKDFKTTKNY